MLFRLLILVIQLKKADFNTKIAEIGKKLLDHGHSNKYITTQKFNKLAAENSAARLKQAKLATKADIADFVKKTDFDDKLKNRSKKATSNKTKHLDVEKKLDDVSEKVKLIYIYIYIYIYVKD